MTSHLSIREREQLLLTYYSAIISPLKEIRNEKY